MLARRMHGMLRRTAPPSRMLTLPGHSRVTNATVSQLSPLYSIGPLQGANSMRHCSTQATSGGDGGNTNRSHENNNTSSSGSAGPLDHHPSLRTTFPPSDVQLPESSFLKCIEKEIMDEKLRLDKDEGPPPVPAGWELHHCDGTSYFYARRLWLPSSRSSLSSSPSSNGSQQGRMPAGKAMEKHFIRVQLTTRDASLDPECDIRGEHFPFSLFVQRIAPEDGGGVESAASFSMEEEISVYHDSIEVRCDFVDGELVVDNLLFHGAFSYGRNKRSSDTTTTDSQATVAAAASHDSADAQSFVSASSSLAEAPGSEVSPLILYNNPFGGYPGPDLNEAEEEVLDGLQAWLAERGIDDQFGEFIGQYSIWVEQAEYERWLQQLYNYVAA